MKSQEKKTAFTLVEMVVVIAIISLLVAILFPVFASVRKSSIQSTCLSNVKQIGIGIFQYAADYDDVIPYADDPSDEYTDAWNSTVYGNDIKHMQLINQVLSSYTSSQQVWRCPADDGITSTDLDNVHWPLNGLPSSYAAYGTSYYYNTFYALNHSSLATMVGYDPSSTVTYGPDEVPLIFDGNGSWHGEEDESQKRYNVLFADGHAKSSNYELLNSELLLNPALP